MDKQEVIHEFFSNNEKYVAQVGHDLEWDEDWPSQMMLLLDQPEPEDGKLPVGLVMFDPRFFESDETKRGLGNAMVSVMREQAPLLAATFVASAWMAKPKTTEEQILMQEHIMTPSMDPNREECVFVLHCDRDGELTYSSAEVFRKEGAPPELGDWDTAKADTMTGRFPEALRKGMGIDA